MRKTHTQPKLADGTLLNNCFLDDWLILSTLGFLFFGKGFVCTALLGRLDLFAFRVSSCDPWFCLLVVALGRFTIVEDVLSM